MCRRLKIYYDESVCSARLKPWSIMGNVRLAPCKGIRIPESRNLLLVESGILGFGIQHKESAILLKIGIQNPTY